jgi:O-antigen/teichoic acid export membrane protein
VVVGRIAAQGIRLVSTLVMTRLLMPEMFGVMAIASVVTVVLTMMSDLGIHQNIVQSRRGEDPDFLDTAWCLQIARGVVLWLAALGVSGALMLLADYLPPDSVYTSPVLPSVIAVTSLSTLIVGFQTTTVATAQRNLQQKQLTLLEVVSQVVGFCFMVVIGIATRSIWALVAGGLVTSLTSVVLGHVWLRHRRDRLRWNASAAHELIHFGKWAFLSSVFTVLSFNGDRVLLGVYLSAEVLGMYAMAVLIVGALEGLIAGLGAVSLPALSETARLHPERLRDVYYKLRLPADLVMLFAGGALVTAGSMVIDLLYDDRYAAAGPMLEILGFSVLVGRYNVSYHIYVAVGRPKYLATINFVRCAALFCVVPAALAFGGVMAAIWAVALHGFAMVPFIFWFNGRIGLLDYKRELSVLVALPAGLACGYLVTLLLG